MQVNYFADLSTRMHRIDKDEFSRKFRNSPSIYNLLEIISLICHTKATTKFLVPFSATGFLVEFKSYAHPSNRDCSRRDEHAPIISLKLQSFALLLIEPEQKCTALFLHQSITHC